MDKAWLIEQLAAQLRQSAEVARRAGEAAREEARSGATPAERREDGRVMQEQSSLARGQLTRAHRALEDLTIVEQFRPVPIPTGGPVGVGAIVEIEDGAE